MTELNQNNEFQTSELPLSAYLMVKGHVLLRIDRAGRQGVFVFRKDKVISDATEYLSGSALVHPGDFNSAIRRLKASLDEALLSSGYPQGKGQGRYEAG